MKKGHCLFCDMLEAEVTFKQRIIFRNEHFTVFLPFFTEYPYGVYIISNAHKSNIAQFDEEERAALAKPCGGRPVCWTACSDTSSPI